MTTGSEIAVVPHTERKHSAVVGGSSAGQVKECPGSAELVTYMAPADDRTSYADEGTALHEAIEYILAGSVTTDRDVIGLTFNEYLITEDLFDDALAPALAQFDLIEKRYVDFEFVQEQRVYFEGIPGAFGLADVIGYGTFKDGSGETVLIDWKFGAGVPVAVEWNAQPMFYAWAGYHTDTTMEFFTDDPDNPIRLVIIQPRINDEPSEWVTTFRQLQVFSRELTAAIDVAQHVATQEGVADIVAAIAKMTMGAGHVVEDLLHELQRTLTTLDEQFTRPVFKEGSHCRWCKAKPACPLKHLNANRALMIDAQEVGDSLGMWLHIADQLEAWISSVRSTAKTRLTDGHPVHGWKLVKGTGQRKWGDREGALAYFKKKRGLKVDDVAPRKLLGLTDMEKLLKKNDLGGIPEEFLSRTTPQDVLVPEDHPGEATELTGAKMETIAAGLRNALGS